MDIKCDAPPALSTQPNIETSVQHYAQPCGSSRSLCSPYGLADVRYSSTPDAYYQHLPMLQTVFRASMNQLYGAPTGTITYGTEGYNLSDMYNAPIEPQDRTSIDLNTEYGSFMSLSATQGYPSLNINPMHMLGLQPAAVFNSTPIASDSVQCVQPAMVRSAVMSTEGYRLDPHPATLRSRMPVISCNDPSSGQSHARAPFFGFNHPEFSFVLEHGLSPLNEPRSRVESDRPIRGINNLTTSIEGHGFDLSNQNPGHLSGSDASSQSVVAFPTQSIPQMPVHQTTWSFEGQDYHVANLGMEQFAALHDPRSKSSLNIVESPPACPILCQPAPQYASNPPRWAATTSLALSDTPSIQSAGLQRRHTGCTRGSMSAIRRKLSREEQDRVLVEERRKKVSYDEIKRKYGMDVTVEALRGRYRNLILPPEKRIRQPKWLASDIKILEEAVPAIMSEGQVRRSRGLTDCNGSHIPWSKVAEFMQRHGASHEFSGKACSKKYKEVKGLL